MIPHHRKQQNVTAVSGAQEEHRVALGNVPKVFVDRIERVQEQVGITLQHQRLLQNQKVKSVIF